MKKIETIFDHDVTDVELTRFGGKEMFEWLKEHGHEPYTSQDDAYYAIGLLYAGRGDYQKAKKYFEIIENKRLLTTLVQDIP